MLTGRELESVAAPVPHDPRPRGVRQRESAPRDDAVLLLAVHLHRAVSRRAAAHVAVGGIARVDERPTVADHLEAAEIELDRVLVVVRMSAGAALPVGTGAQAEPGIARAQHGDARVRQQRASRGRACHQRPGARQPRPLRRIGRSGKRRVERAARQKRQRAAGVEIAHLWNLSRRAQRQRQAAEEAAHGALDAAGHRQVRALRRQHRRQEHLRAEALVAGGRLEMSPVGPALPDNLRPELAGERIVPGPQLGKERARDHHSHQVRGVVVGADRPGLLQVPRHESAVLLEEVEQFRHQALVAHESEAERHRHGAQRDLHRARPLHAQAHRIGGAETAHGLDPRARPLRVAGERERLREAPQVRQAPHLPHHLGVGAGPEDVDLRPRHRGVVAHLWSEGIAVPVELARLAEQRHFAAQRSFRFGRANRN